METGKRLNIETVKLNPNPTHSAIHPLYLSLYTTMSQGGYAIVDVDDEVGKAIASER